MVLHFSNKNQSIVVVKKVGDTFEAPRRSFKQTNKHKKKRSVT